MEKVKLGFVGCGFMGQLAHLVNFVESDKCEVVALAEIREQLAKKVADKYGIPKLYKSHKELAADNDVEAVVEITADSEHAPIAIDLMKAGKHVLTEKPMATNLADAQKMVDVAQDNNVKLMVTYMKRYDPGVQKAKEILVDLVKNKELGEITFIRVHCYGGEWVCNIGKPISTDEPRPESKPSFPAWLPQDWGPKFLGYNNVFCHNINLLRYFTGEIRAVNYVELGEKGRRSGKIAILDLGDFIASVETGSISANFWDEEIKIYFENGWVEILTPPPMLRNVVAKVEVYKGGKIQQLVQSYGAWDWSFKRCAEHFLDCIIEDREPISSGKDSNR